MAATQLTISGANKLQVARLAIENGWSANHAIAISCPDTTTNKTLITNLATQNGCTVVDTGATTLTLSDDRTKPLR